MPCEKHF